MDINTHMYIRIIYAHWYQNIGTYNLLRHMGRYFGNAILLERINPGTALKRLEKNQSDSLAVKAIENK
jgi:hypothetical protein